MKKTITERIVAIADEMKELQGATFAAPARKLAATSTSRTARENTVTKTLRDVLCDRCVAALEKKGVNLGEDGSVSLRFTSDDLCRRCQGRFDAWVEKTQGGYDESARYDGFDDFDDLDELL
jgi:hypothetical protein